MRYPEDHKDAVRGRIVAAASRALRGLGLAGVGIPALMKRAGLTHGGFYRHFTTRHELVAEALRAAADETLPRIFGAAVGAEDPLAAVLDAYLSATHCAHAEHGCPLAALGGEAPRQAPEVRRAFAEISRRFLRELDAVVRRGPPQADLHDDTLAVASAMIGAIVLARMVRDESLAGRVLAAARRLARRAT